MKAIFIWAVSLSMVSCAAAATSCKLGTQDAPSLLCKAVPATALSHPAPFVALKREFDSCDTNDTFFGVTMPDGYKCTKGDANSVSVLVSLPNQMVYWHSKMALDVDGCWASWNGIVHRTTQQQTAYQWSGVSDKNSEAAQLDPDAIPYLVIPGADPMIDAHSPDKGKYIHVFENTTGIKKGDVGIVFDGDLWTPVIVGDVGPINRLAEASSLTHLLLGEDRCKSRTPDGKHCIDYHNTSFSHPVSYLIVPHSKCDLVPGATHGECKAPTPATIKGNLCDYAKLHFNLSSGSNYCSSR